MSRPAAHRHHFGCPEKKCTNQYLVAIWKQHSKCPRCFSSTPGAYCKIKNEPPYCICLDLAFVLSALGNVVSADVISSRAKSDSYQPAGPEPASSARASHNRKPRPPLASAIPIETDSIANMAAPSSARPVCDRRPLCCVYGATIPAGIVVFFYCYRFRLSRQARSKLFRGAFVNGREGSSTRR